jgi:TetR/AcrR family transcriptional repressor of nem operon
VPPAPGQSGKGAATRERILAAAADLIHERGMNAVSLGDVLRASGTGKGQLYQHFGSREELVNRVLERNAEFVAEHAPPIETWADLRAWMVGYAERQRDAGYLRGCPIGTVGYALQPQQDVPRETVRRTFDGMRDAIASFLRAELRAARLAPGADPRRLADFAIAAVQGALILGLVERDPRPVENVIEEAYAHVAGHVVPE